MFYGKKKKKVLTIALRELKVHISTIKEIELSNKFFFVYPTFFKLIAKNKFI